MTASLLETKSAQPSQMCALALPTVFMSALNFCNGKYNKDVILTSGCLTSLVLPVLVVC